MSPLSPADFQAAAAVSRETTARLALYLKQLRRWQGTINLVGAATLADPWRRHMLDSAQLLPHIPPTTRRLVDFGSGAGFPGLVLALCLGEGRGQNATPFPNIHLVESDTRKAAFLTATLAALALPPPWRAAIHIHPKRVETLSPAELPGDPATTVVTARALAPLERLLPLAAPHMSGGRALFLKGQGVDEELTAAAKAWTMETTRYTSMTDTTGCILCITGLGPRDAGHPGQTRTP